MAGMTFETNQYHAVDSGGNRLLEGDGICSGSHCLGDIITNPGIESQSKLVCSVTSSGLFFGLRNRIWVNSELSVLYIIDPQ